MALSVTVRMDGRARTHVRLPPYWRQRVATPAFKFYGPDVNLLGVVEQNVRGQEATQEGLTVDAGAGRCPPLCASLHTVGVAFGAACDRGE